MSNLEQFEADARKIVEEAVNLLVKKRKDYGPNALHGGKVGIAIRLSDKQARLENLLGITDGSFKPKAQNVKESTNDTMLDILNYAILYLLDENNKNG